MSWNKKQSSNLIDIKVKRNGTLYTKEIYKDYRKRGAMSRDNKLLIIRLATFGRAIVTGGHITMTDDQIAKTIVYNQ